MHEVLIKIIDLVIRVRKWFGDQGKSILRWLIWLAQRALDWLDRGTSQKTSTDVVIGWSAMHSAAARGKPLYRE